MNQTGYQILENQTAYAGEQLLQLAKRENNPKRQFLLVNPLQGKHIPINPEKSLQLFKTLGKLVLQQAQPQKNEKVVVIGFAETATAIGAGVAACFAPNTLYLHTTREKIGGMTNLVDFQEEHSHAMEQFLFCQNQGQALKEADKLIFVEDELTTGKTVLNFIGALKQNRCLNPNCKIWVASLLNSMSAENHQKFADERLNCCYLLKIQGDFKPLDLQVREGHRQVKAFLSSQGKAPVLQAAKGMLNPRTGVEIGSYLTACQNLANQVQGFLPQPLTNKTVLVLGSEEFMYPGILLGAQLKKTFSPCKVWVHATTRSPILAFNQGNYPLKNRSKLISLYEAERVTFLYNLKKYDQVIVVTDAEQQNQVGYQDLVKTLQHYGNQEILGVRWSTNG